ncbi:ATP-binding protein [Bifidobacterium simiiventris]|uniref:ATP-binding protein n=1 Tax=Bifidobacterium simiiventris TaxID=2834434 RepID=UPI001C564109|nr:ATP-binding protein [Bifidobacterium simiiventris]MBW3079163.1 ATP-binding protein [Bifidobacterium simiiventris]
MKRKAYDRIKFWKDHKTKQALLVTGARQVGKTFIIEEFGRNEYEHMVEFNLVLDDNARRSFSQATSPDDLLFRISVASNVPLVPGRTLVFLDEIQQCPQIVTFIKGLVDKGDYDYILSGSLLGVELEDVRSLPVGYLDEFAMYPLDFEEFCWANGLVESAFDVVRNSFANLSEIPDFIHDRLTDLFHRYLLVGGMPAAVAAFAANGVIDPVRAVQSNIRAYYEHDIKQYAPKANRLTIQEIYRLIPGELQSQNRRFQVSSITDIKRFSQIEDEFLWLTNANVALPAFNVAAPIAPLRINADRRVMKLFYSDVGLLVSAYGKKSALGILEGNAAMNMGGVYENVAAQELVAHGFTHLYYLTKKGVGELDFLVETNDGDVLALEIKSGAYFRSHAALDKAMATPGYGIDRAYVFAETNVFTEGNVIYLPMYMLSMLVNE